MITQASPRDLMLISARAHYRDLGKALNLGACLLIRKLATSRPLFNGYILRILRKTLKKLYSKSNFEIFTNVFNYLY